MLSSLKKMKKMLTLRDPKDGYKTLLAVLYALCADVIALVLMSWGSQPMSQPMPIVTTVLAIGLAAHGRVVASFLVHECTHSTLFVQASMNHLTGTACLWLAGVPYADFHRVKDFHLKHHKDRADTVEFDYRTFVREDLPVCMRRLILAGEWCLLPVVETGMHCRTALAPILFNMGCQRRRRAAKIGVTAMGCFYGCLYWVGGGYAVAAQVVAGALCLQILSIHDCFTHTYEAFFLDETYVPGPKGRTAQYEEINTYSLLTLGFGSPTINMGILNFGFHNAHHVKPMVPWYKLPDLHTKLYNNKVDSSQVIYHTELLRPWFEHRLRRVLEENYGTVQDKGTPQRTVDFVGTLGISFLTY
jgi:fatty acid desaturase